MHESGEPTGFSSVFSQADLSFLTHIRVTYPVLYSDPSLYNVLILRGHYFRVGLNQVRTDRPRSVTSSKNVIFAAGGSAISFRHIILALSPCRLTIL